MNRKRKIVVVSAIAIVALGVTGWSVLAGAAWPPTPYQACSGAGSWTKIDGSGDITLITLNAEDPATGMASGMATEITMDPTLGGMLPEATSLSPWFCTCVKTGPNASAVKQLCYVKKDGKPKPTILSILIVEQTATMTAPDAMSYEGTLSIFSAAADKDGDGLPDTGEQPLVSLPLKGHMKRI